MFRKSYIVVIMALAALMAALVGCSGNGGSPDRSVGGSGTVNIGISDPPTCASPNGNYDAVYVTITGVKIHTSSTAGANDAGWIDLTPNMSPKQVNLFGQTDQRCLLAMLGQGKQLAAGTYQQIRVYLAPDSAAGQITNNSCGNGVANCVVVGGVARPLLLSSETQAGIKIPAGQLAGGQFKVATGETKDLVIDFDACASIVAQGNQFRLKPVLHAGEVQVAASVGGQLVDSVTSAAVIGKSIVTLQGKDSNNINRVVMQTTTDLAGNFVLCPVPAGTYDLVATAVSNGNVQYATTVITGVTPGATIAQVPMVAQTGASTAPASIAGQVTTSKTPAAATPADIMVSALQQITAGGSTYSITVPLAQQQSATLSLATGTTGCPANTNCASYTASVPAMWPNIAAYSTGTMTFTQSTATPVTYAIEGQAFVQGSAGTQDCTPPVVAVTTLTGGGNINVTPGANLTVATMTFTGCQ